jgi:alpha-tubulin suppressor-like RCC1 family protein
MAANTPSTAAVQVQLDPGSEAGPIYLTDVASVQQGFTGYLAMASCAVTNAGAVYCWGPWGYGNLAQTGASEPYATQVLRAAATPIDDAVQMAAGSRHACYLNDAGEVWCWGTNIGGPLGNGTDTASLYPVRAGSLTGVSKVAAGPDVSCALVSQGADAGRVFCWGSTGAGQVGIGPPASNTDGCINYCKLSPARVRTDASTYLEGVVDIATGYQTTCALRSDSSVWCWGTSGGVYATAMQAPAGTPVDDVAELAVHSGTPRVLLRDGTLWNLPSATTSQAVAVSCGLLD